MVSLKVMDFVAPRGDVRAPALVELPPLPPAPRASTVMAPVAIALSAIRDAADRGAPRNFNGKADNPISQILENADIGWTASRGPIAATGAQDVLSLATPLTGTLNVTGSLSAKATGAVGDALGGLLGGNVAKQIGSINIKNLNASAEIKGNVVITARPKIAADWRIEPNLAGAGQSRRHQPHRGRRARQRAGAGQAADRQECRRTDRRWCRRACATIRRFEQNARAQWAKACRSIPLQGTSAGSTMPALWLELRPTRAIAAQPRVDASAVTLTLGIEAETRITPAETKPACPFPATITIVPPTPGRVAIGVPDRHAVHRDQQDRRGAVRRKDLSGGRLGPGRRHRQARQRRGFRRSPADFAAGECEGEEELSSASAARPTCISGAGPCSIRRSRRCG